LSEDGVKGRGWGNNPVGKKQKTTRQRVGKNISSKNNKKGNGGAVKTICGKGTGLRRKRNIARHMGWGWGRIRDLKRVTYDSGWGSGDNVEI